MKSTQLKKENESVKIKNNILKNSLTAGIIGFLSWLAIYVFWVPIISFIEFGYFRSLDPLQVLKIWNIYPQSLFVGIIFFLFFYLTLKYKEQSKAAKIIMWIGIILYALFYLGYLFLLFIKDYRLPVSVSVALLQPLGPARGFQLLALRRWGLPRPPRFFYPPVLG